MAASGSASTGISPGEFEPLSLCTAWTCDEDILCCHMHAHHVVVGTETGGLYHFHLQLNDQNQGKCILRGKIIATNDSKKPKRISHIAVVPKLGLIMALVGGVFRCYDMDCLDLLSSHTANKSLKWVLMAVQPAALDSTQVLVSNKNGGAAVLTLNSGGEITQTTEQAFPDTPTAAWFWENKLIATFPGSISSVDLTTGKVEPIPPSRAPTMARIRCTTVLPSPEDLQSCRLHAAGTAPAHTRPHILAAYESKSKFFSLAARYEAARPAVPWPAQPSAMTWLCPYLLGWSGGSSRDVHACFMFNEAGQFPWAQTFTLPRDSGVLLDLQSGWTPDAAPATGAMTGALVVCKHALHHVSQLPWEVQAKALLAYSTPRVEEALSLLRRGAPSGHAMLAAEAAGLSEAVRVLWLNGQPAQAAEYAALAKLDPREYLCLHPELLPAGSSLLASYTPTVFSVDLLRGIAAREVQPRQAVGWSGDDASIGSKPPPAFTELAKGILQATGQSDSPKATKALQQASISALVKVLSAAHASVQTGSASGASGGSATQPWAEAVDMALLTAAIVRSQEQEMIALLTEPSALSLPAVREQLSRYSLYAALARHMAWRGMHNEAMQLYKQLAFGKVKDDSGSTGVEAAVAMLSKSTDPDFVKRHTAWILRHPDKKVRQRAMDVLRAAVMASPPVLEPNEVLGFLEAAAGSSSGAVGAASSAGSHGGAMDEDSDEDLAGSSADAHARNYECSLVYPQAFMEICVYNCENRDSLLHTKLGNSYIRALQLPGVHSDAVTQPDNWGEVLRAGHASAEVLASWPVMYRLKYFLHSSHVYDADTLLKQLQSGLLDIRVMLLARVNDHAAALKLLVMHGKYDDALGYAAAQSAQAKQSAAGSSGKSRKVKDDPLLTLLKMFLNPTTKSWKATFRAQAMRLLQLYAGELDARRAIKLLPADMPIAELAGPLSTLIRGARVAAGHATACHALYQQSQIRARCEVVEQKQAVSAARAAVLPSGAAFSEANL